jgi:hypothetical protein
MKFFRVGSCLALLSAVVSCSQAPQSMTAPTAAVGGSTAETAAADGSTLKVTAPPLVSPVDGARAEDRRPTLIWVNSTGKYGGIGVAYDIELSTPAAVVYSRTVGEGTNIGAHLVDMDLEFDTVYSWRVRAHLGNPDAYGPWSPWASFLSPTKPVPVAPVGNTLGGACSAPLSPLQPGENRKPRPNDSAIVSAIAGQFPALLQHSCQPEGGSWEFMDRAVDALRSKDGRYGYNCKRGNCNDPSVDVVSYFYRDGDNINFRPDVYIFDIIGGHCGSNPTIIWNDVTDITFQSGTEGRTIFPRVGRVGAPSPCTAAAATAK